MYFSMIVGVGPGWGKVEASGGAGCDTQCAAVFSIHTSATADIVENCGGSGVAVESGASIQGCGSISNTHGCNS
jgi:hypothetical protein